MVVRVGRTDKDKVFNQLHYIMNSICFKNNITNQRLELYSAKLKLSVAKFKLS